MVENLKKYTRAVLSILCNLKLRWWNRAKLWCI